MAPFVNPSTPVEERFNKALTTTHAKIECTFGILKNKFQCLMQPLRVVGPERSGDVILATMVLHNIAIMNSDFFEPLQAGQQALIGCNDTGSNDNVDGQRIRNFLVTNHFS